MHNCVTCIVQWTLPIESKPLRDLKGYPSLATILTKTRGSASTPPLLLSVTAHTHRKTHPHIHMSDSCQRLPSQSGSFLPTFLSQPHCFVSRRSTNSWPQRTPPQRGLQQHRHSSTWAFIPFHPGRFRRPKTEAAWRTWGEIWLTRNHFLLLQLAWAEQSSITSNECNSTNQSLRRG